MITKQFHVLGAQRGAISAVQAGLIVVFLLVIAGGAVFLIGIWPPEEEPAPSVTTPPPAPPPAPIVTEIEELAPKPPPPPPPPIPEKRMTRAEAREKKFAFKGKLAQRHQHSKIEDRHIKSRIKDDGGAHLVSKNIAEVPRNEAYVIKSGRKDSIINVRFNDKLHRRNLLLMHEVMSPPISLRTDQKW